MTEALLRLLRWWADELSLLLPERFRPRDNDAVALWRDGRIALWLRAKGGVTPLGPAEAAQRNLRLRLNGEKFWRRDFLFPRAARPYLRQIFTQEMDRRTPWRADQVYFRCDAVTDPASRDQLRVTLTLLPRKSAQTALAGLATLGLRADSIELTEDADPALPAVAVRIEDGEAMAPGGTDLPRRFWPLFALAGLALLSLIGQSLWLAALEFQTAQARQDAKAVRQIAADIAQIERQRHFPSQLKRQTPSAIATLNALAQALPDDAYAEDITLGEGHLLISGQAKDAASLLARLDGSGLLANAEFRAPVTSAEGGLQKFQIAAEIREAAHAAP